MDQAASAAAGALESWSRSSPDDRAAVLRRMADLIEERAEEITRTIVSEVGQPQRLAAQLQTASPAQNLRIIADAISEVAWEEQIGHTVVRRAPAGVVGAITPWNVPLLMICMKAGAAIAAGCTVVLKGSEIAPLSSFIFAEITPQAGLPDGVFNLVSGTGPEVGEALVAHPLVDMVSLTGSVRAGRRVMEVAAQSIKRVGLELGGKSANIILEDSDFERAVSDGIADAFRNAGQACGGLTRVLVPRRRLADAAELAVATATSYVLGDPFDPATTLGPVTTSGQRARIRGYIQAGLDEGARLLTGGVRAAGRPGARLLRPADGLHRRQHDARRPRGDLRAGRRDHPLRRRGGGDRHRQRLPLRAGRRGVVRRRRARARHRHAAAGRAGSHQRVGGQPAGAARGLQAVRHRPRMGTVRHRGIP